MSVAAAVVVGDEGKGDQPAPTSAIYDDFQTKNTSLWSFANRSKSSEGTGSCRRIIPNHIK